MNSEQVQNENTQGAFEQPYAAPPYVGQNQGFAPYPPFPNAYVPYQQKQKTKMLLEPRDHIFAGISFLLSLCIVIFGLWGNFHLGLTVSYLLTFCALTVYLGKDAHFPGPFTLLCGVSSLILSSVFFITTASSVRFFSVLLLPCLATVWLAGLSGRRITDQDLGLLHFLLTVVGGAICSVPQGIKAIFTSGNKKSKHFSKIIIGVLCALPILFAVVPLLSSSDEAFSNLLHKLFSDTGMRAAQVVLSILLTPFLTGYAFYLKKEPPKAAGISTFKGVDTVILTSSLSVLSFVYLFYLFSQLAYFFSGFLGILPEGYGFSHAEYARRGFFELCAIAGINLAVLFAALLLSRKQNGKPPLALRIPSTFIILFNLLLIVTAISKLVLYIRAYGMTVLRLGTCAFTVFMAYVFITLLLRFYLPKIRVLSAAIPAAACILIVLGIGNINHVVAEYNYNLYTSNHSCEADVDYFGQLGAEGVTYLVMLAEDKNEKLAKEAQIALYFALPDHYNTEYKTSSAYPYYEYYKITGKRYANPSQFCISRNKMYQETEAFLSDHPNFTFECAREADGWYDDSFD